MKMISIKQFVAIKPLVFNKVEAKVQGGLALIAQKREAVSAALVMDYYVDEQQHYFAGSDSVILRGDTGLRPWNKEVLSLDGKEFVLCPVGEILGYVKGPRNDFP